MLNLEDLLKQQDEINTLFSNSNTDEETPKQCEPGQGKGLQRSLKGASLTDFIDMVGTIVEYTLEDLNVKFMPDENKKNFTDPDTSFDHSIITYKVNSRKPKNELKPMAREEVKENCDGQDRLGMKYGIRYDCKVQFNVFASEYAMANKIMERFEELMISYAGYYKENGVANLYFTNQYTDSEYNNFRETMSVRNLEYYVEIEKIIVIFNEKIKDIPVYNATSI